LTVKADRNKNYPETLCQKVVNTDTEIWNINWLNDQNIIDLFINTSIINDSEIEEMQQVIEPNEISVFGY